MVTLKGYTKNFCQKNLMKKKRNEVKETKETELCDFQNRA